MRLHIHDFKVENKEDIKNFLKTSNIFSPHQLVTGNALSTYQLYGKLFRLDVFDKLANSIMDIVKSFVDMWANVNLLNTNVRPHNHFSEQYPNSVVGVYYLTKPKDSGNLIIEDTEVEINEDDLIFFDDVDMHWSKKNESNQHRFAISFNMNKQLKKYERESKGYTQKSNRREF